MGRLDSLQFRAQHSLAAARKEIPVRADTGFTKLRGIAIYMPASKRLKVQINGIKAKGNKGPTYTFEKTVDWPQGGGSFDEMASHLSALLKGVSAALTSKQQPVVSDLINRCNTTGMLASKFKDSVCVDCRCWYCSRSGS